MSDVASIIPWIVNPMGAVIGMVTDTVFGKKNESTNTNAPATPPGAASQNAQDEETALRAAQDRRKIAAAASGRGSTILTGLGGLGTSSAAPHTLLGE